MTDVRQKKENIKMHLKDLRHDLKKMHLAVTEELLLPQPDEIKTLMYKMDQLLKAIPDLQCNVKPIRQQIHLELTLTVALLDD